jgi:hypoxanthine phosphoribosyltransferase
MKVQLFSRIGQQSTGIVKALSGIKSDVKGRHVVIVEDIVETGITITAVIAEL